MTFMPLSTIATDTEGFARSTAACRVFRVISSVMFCFEFSLLVVQINVIN